MNMHLTAMAHKTTQEFTNNLSDNNIMSGIVQEKTIFCMRLILVEDSLGVKKGRENPEGNWRLSTDIELVTLEDCLMEFR